MPTAFISNKNAIFGWLNNHLHILSFDVPFPANYGGVIDVFYKLQALKEQGIKIHLHCFAYGRKPSPELEQLCEQVYYYERRTGFGSFLSLLPYNVKSRQSKELEDNLLKDTYPVLCEVLHTSYILSDPRFKNRKRIYRHSNIEHEYYQELSKAEKSFLKKIYLKIEAWKLKRFEKIIHHADLILAVNKKDTAYFLRNYPKVKSLYLPSFHANKVLNAKEGRGNYVLFHGNLSVSENYEAAEWLMKNVFSKLNMSCKIAGLNPPGFLKHLIANYPHITLIENPTEEQMNQLIREAQIHVLYTAQPTGLKLKLLNVLFNGRFVVCNTNMISGTDLQANSSVVLCNHASQFIETINNLMFRDFSSLQMAQRKEMVGIFDTKRNAEKLIDVIYNG